MTYEVANYWATYLYGSSNNHYFVYKHGRKYSFISVKNYRYFTKYPIVWCTDSPTHKIWPNWFGRLFL